MEPRYELIFALPYRQIIRRQAADVGKSREELAEMRCYKIK
jgi:hypothetical protein